MRPPMTSNTTMAIIQKMGAPRRFLENSLDAVSKPAQAALLQFA